MQKNENHTSLTKSRNNNTYNIASKNKINKSSITNKDNSNVKLNNRNDNKVINNQSNISKKKNSLIKKHISKTHNITPSSKINKEQTIKEISTNEDRSKTIDYLNNKIISKISKRFVKSLDEIDIIESELYIINNVQNEELTLKELDNTKKIINSLLAKIDMIKTKYNLIKTYIEDDIYLEDSEDFLDRDIEYLKELTSLNETKDNIEKIKEYELLALNLKTIEEQVINLDKIKEHKKEEIEQRDITYKQLLNTYLNNKSIEEKCHKLLDEINKDLDSIKFTEIDKVVYEKEKIVGLGDYIYQKMRLFFLFFSRPFKHIKSFFNLLNKPYANTYNGIVESTILGKLMIDQASREAYKKIHIEKTTEVMYHVSSYQQEIELCLNNLDYTYHTINNTLDSINSIKDKYTNLLNNKYITEDMKNTYSNILEIEKLLLSNQRKTKIMLNRANEMQKINNDRVNKVKKLNIERNMI